MSGITDSAWLQRMRKLMPKDTNLERYMGIDFVGSKKGREKTGSPLWTGELNSLSCCDGGAASDVRRRTSAGANTGSVGVFFW